MRRAFPVFAPVILVLLVLESEAASGIRVIAATGQSAPGVPGDYKFDYFLANSPTINDRGEVAFVARSSTPSLRAVTGIWTTAGNQLAPLITDIDPAPGIPNDRAFTLHFNHVAINNSGATTFDNRIEWWHTDVRLGTEGGIWSNHEGGLRLVTRMGDPAPGAPAGSVLDELPMALRSNDAGDIAFLAQFDDDLDNDRDPSRHGIWMHSGDQLVPIAVTGGPAPGYATGSFQKLDAPLLNNAGRLAFTGQVRAEGQIHRGLWSDRTGSVAPVLLEGDLLPISDSELAPSTGSTRFALNGNDAIAFSTLVERPGDQTQAGLWLETEEGLSLVVAQGQHAPGTPAESVFQYGAGEFSLNDAGQIAFSASYTTDRMRFEPRLGDYVPVFESGIWLYDDEQLQLIAREGDLAPSFAMETRFRSFSPPMINGLGQVVFRANLESIDEAGASVELSSLWATNLNGHLKMVARTGMQIDIDAGLGVDLREILNIEFGHKLETIASSARVYAGTTDGRGRSFNDRGELAFHVRFSDDTGIGSALLVVDTLAIPEPASLALAGPLCVALLTTRMRGRRIVRKSEIFSGPTGRQRTKDSDRRAHRHRSPLEGRFGPIGLRRRHRSLLQRCRHGLPPHLARPADDRPSLRADRRSLNRRYWANIDSGGSTRRHIQRRDSVRPRTNRPARPSWDFAAAVGSTDVGVRLHRGKRPLPQRAFTSAAVSSVWRGLRS